MLKEISRFRSYGGDANRRVFVDKDMDLYVWFNQGVPQRFHLSYNKRVGGGAVGWNNESGFEQRPFAQLEAFAVMTGWSPLLDLLFMQNGQEISASALAYQFLQASNNIAPWLADFIYARLMEYPGHNAFYISQDTVVGSF